MSQDCRLSLNHRPFGTPTHRPALQCICRPKGLDPCGWYPVCADRHAVLGGWPARWPHAAPWRNSGRCRSSAPDAGRGAAAGSAGACAAASSAGACWQHMSVCVYVCVQHVQQVCAGTHTIECVAYTHRPGLYSKGRPGSCLLWHGL